MAEVMWFYQRGTQTIGPVTQADLCLMFKRSELPLEINVYSDAIGQWTPAEQIRGFREAVLPPGSGRPIVSRNSPGPRCRCRRCGNDNY